MNSYVVYFCKTDYGFKSMFPKIGDVDLLFLAESEFSWFTYPFSMSIHISS